MDQNQLSSLDPKLKEAYERVMNTAGAPATQTPQPSVQTAPSNVSQPSIQPANSPMQTQAVQTPESPLTESLPQTPSATNEQVNPPVVVNQPATIASPTIPLQTQTTTPAPMTESMANSQIHAYVADEVAGVKQSLQLIQLMYIGGGLLFFAVYALFWMKFFNVALPF